MGFNDYSKKQNDQLQTGVDIVKERRERVEKVLNARLEHIKTLGYKKELFVDSFRLDFEYRQIHILLKYCEEYDDFIRYDNYESLSSRDKKTIDECIKFENEIIEYVDKLIKDEKLATWNKSISRSGIIKK